MQSSKLIFKNTLWQVLAKVITAGLTLLITILTTRALGVSGFGDLTKILSFVALFYLVSDFGFNAIVVREITAKPQKTKEYFTNLLGLRLFWSLGLIFLMGIILFFLPYNFLTGQGFSPVVKTGILIASFTILAQAVFITSNAIFQAKMRYDQTFFSSTAGTLITLLLISVLVFMGASLLPIVSAYSLGGLVMMAVSLFLTTRILKKFSLVFNFSFWKRLFFQTLPISLTLIFNLIYFRIDMLLLAGMRQTFEVGLYGLSYRIFDVLLSLPIFFVNALYPVLIQDLKEDGQRFRLRIKRAVFLMLGFSLFLGTAIYLAAPFLVDILGGPGFEGSVLALRILILGLPLFYLSVVFQWLLIVLKREKILAYFYAGGAGLNIILNLIFIPFYGYLAAAVITGITEFVVLVLLIVASWQNLRLPMKVN